MKIKNIFTQTRDTLWRYGLMDFWSARVFPSLSLSSDIYQISFRIPLPKKHIKGSRMHFESPEKHIELDS